MELIEEQAQAAPETTPTAAQATTPGAEQVQQQPASAAAPDGKLGIDQIDTDKLSLDDLDTLMGERDKPGQAIDIPLKGAGQQEKALSQPAAPETPGAEPVVTPETPAAPETKPPAAPPAAPAPTEPEAELPERFRFQDERDRRIASLRKGGMSWAEAERFVDGQTEQTPGAAPTQVKSAKEMLEESSTKLTDLRQKRLDAAQSESLDNEDLARLEIDIAEESGRNAVLQREAEAEERDAEALRIQAAQQSEQNKLASRQRAMKSYPDVANAATPLGAAVAKRVEEMSNPNHPDHAILYADNAAEFITARIADEMGIEPVKASLPVVPQAPTVPTPRAVAPVPGSARTVVPVQPQPQASLQKLRDSSSLEELDAAFGATGQPLVGAVRG